MKSGILVCIGRVVGGEYIGKWLRLDLSKRSLKIQGKFLAIAAKIYGVMGSDVRGRHSHEEIFGPLVTLLLKAGQIVQGPKGSISALQYNWTKATRFRCPVPIFKPFSQLQRSSKNQSDIQNTLNPNAISEFFDLQKPAQEPRPCLMANQMTHHFSRQF